MGGNKDLAQGGVAPEKKQRENLKGEQTSSQQSRRCLHPQLRKTKFCMFHLQGSCKFGKDCAFAHNVKEMNSAPDLSKTHLCKAFANGTCEDPGCNYAHGHKELRSTGMFLKKTLCFWNEKGKCCNGSHCRFAHGFNELNKKAGLAIESTTQSKAGPQRKGKQNQKPTNIVTIGNGGSSDNVHISSSDSPGSGSSSCEYSGQCSSCNDFSRQCTSSTDFSRQRSTSDVFSRQCSSASEPMKIQPPSESPEQPSMDAPDQMQNQWQDSFSSRLANLESDYLALAATGCQQHLNSTGSYGRNSGLQADIDNLRQSLGALTAQCSQIQESIDLSPVEMPSWPYMMQSPILVTPYPDPASMLLWQMQVQA